MSPPLLYQPLSITRNNWAKIGNFQQRRDENESPAARSSQREKWTGRRRNESGRPCPSRTITGFLLLRLVRQAEFELQEENSTNTRVQDLCLCNIAHDGFRHVGYVEADVFHAERDRRQDAGKR